MIKILNDINLLCNNDCIQNKFKYDIRFLILIIYFLIKYYFYRDEKYFRYFVYYNSLLIYFFLIVVKNLVNLCKWLRSYCLECVYDQEILILFLLRILVFLNLKFFQIKVQICIFEFFLVIIKFFNRLFELLKGQCKSFIDIIFMYLCIQFFFILRILKFDFVLYILILFMRFQVRKVINVMYRFFVFQRCFK